MSPVSTSFHIAFAVSTLHCEASHDSQGNVRRVSVVGRMPFSCFGSGNGNSGSFGVKLVRRRSCFGLDGVCIILCSMGRRHFGCRGILLLAKKPRVPVFF